MSQWVDKSRVQGSGVLRQLECSGCYHSNYIVSTRLLNPGGLPRRNGAARQYRAVLYCTVLYSTYCTVLPELRQAYTTVVELVNARPTRLQAAANEPKFRPRQASDRCQGAGENTACGTEAAKF